MKKTSQPIKQKTLVGNIANQKYEASRNIERHIEIITNTQPTQETTRWKASQPYYFMKQEGRLVVEERLRNKDNQLFNQRLHQLATERREPDAREHAPGWRTGRGTLCNPCSFDVQFPLQFFTSYFVNASSFPALPNLGLNSFCYFS